MNMVLPPKTAAIFIVAVCLWSRISESVPNTNITNVLCNAGVYTSGDPFAISVAYVLEEIERETPTQTNFDYYNVSPYPNAFAYGYAGCNQNLTTSDCRICLGDAKTALFAACLNRIGARSVLHDCSIRYEQYPFD